MPQPFLLLVYFSEKVLHFCLGPAAYQDPPTPISHLAEIIVIHLYTQLFVGAVCFLAVLGFEHRA
jgi:hypothetical protein